MVLVPFYLVQSHRSRYSRCMECRGAKRGRSWEKALVAAIASFGCCLTDHMVADGHCEKSMWVPVKTTRPKGNKVLTRYTASSTR